ncbi:2OG-Fe(II) oxygenase [Roseofilum capinflatum]|uniref:2OG-Fe(II) oxygenase n=1 Tax=Roseofilum capinflatum BLCC-M114 TaxID=3022440 RepID=A0ABT7B5B4_9CYAN|nr:2OG-Fe(II) oxygenase [Roseofilum capinflatum]MDJ1174358.1 2OG-Fe(II) oxygenase [Roseofilum capinflatum BLCC-M114]
MIHTVIFEDRKESSILWHYAIHKQLISEDGNILLHINRYINDQPNLAALYGIYPHEISIAHFLVPMIHRGLFKEVYWLYPNQEVPSQSLWVCTYTSQSGEILTYKTFHKEEIDSQTFLQWLIKPKYKLQEFQTLNPKSTILDQPDRQGVVLDIVSDYFSINSSPAHPEDQLQRIDELVDFLKQNSIDPKLICIRRSQISGFRGEEQWPWIQEQLVERLSQIYPLQFLSLDEIWENNQLREEYKQEKKKIVSSMQLSESKRPSGSSSGRSSSASLTEVKLDSGRIRVYDNLIPHDLLTEIYNYYQSGLRWEFKNYGDEDDLFTSFWATEEFPDSIDQLRQLVTEQLDYKPDTPRTIVNGHVFALGDSIHRDSENLENPGQTAVCYINPMWRADWDGETKFYSHRDLSQADLIYSCLPKPGRVIIFDNTIPHRGCAPSRLCNKLRVTVAYQFPPPNAN